LLNSDANSLFLSNAGCSDNNNHRPAQQLLTAQSPRLEEESPGFLAAAAATGDSNHAPSFQVTFLPLCCPFFGSSPFACRT